MQIPARDAERACPRAVDGEVLLDRQLAVEQDRARQASLEDDHLARIGGRDLRSQRARLAPSSASDVTVPAIAGVAGKNRAVASATANAVRGSLMSGW